MGQSTLDGAADDAWHQKVALLLGPNPALPSAAQHVIKLDYGITNGQASMEYKQALLFYALKRLGLLEGQEAPPAVQQVALLTR